jgi:anti-anti-sigma factor
MSVEPLDWNFQNTFLVTITDSDDTIRVGFAGDFDALAVAVFRQKVTILGRPGSDVVLDLTDLEHIDMTGAREIRRIQLAVEGSGARSRIEGASEDARRMLRILDR